MTFLRRSRSASPPTSRGTSPQRSLFGVRSNSYTAPSSLPMVIQSPSSSVGSYSVGYASPNKNCFSPYKSSPRKGALDLIVRRTSAASRAATFAAFLLMICGAGVYGRYASLRYRLEVALFEHDELFHINRDLIRELGRIEAESKQTIRHLKEKIQSESRREVEDKFGTGPYHVKFDLEIPRNDAEGEGDSRRAQITVETAPLDLMPHAANLFLQQVSRGVWDGTEIFKNREHILLARDFDHATGRDKMSDLVDMGVANLAYREHSDEYPHNPYTMGFAGQPGGPNFYFNKEDNHEWHGAGPNDGDEGDPCFATVIEGKDVLDEMGGLPTDGKTGLLERPVVIRRATIFTKNNFGLHGRFEEWSTGRAQ